MNLRQKKALAARTFGVGKGRIRFIEGRMDEIKEAITSQDMRSLFEKGAIEVKPIKGRLKNVSRTTRRGPGKIKKKLNFRKRDYVRKTRKLRAHTAALRRSGKIDSGMYEKLRREIRSSNIKSKSHLNEYLKETK